MQFHTWIKIIKGADEEGIQETRSSRYISFTFLNIYQKIKLILGNDEAFPFLLKKEFIDLDEDFSDEEDEVVPVPSTSKVK